MKIFKFIVIVNLLTFLACSSPNPNINEAGQDELESLEINRVLESIEHNFEDILYVPIYSEIYVDKIYQASLLSATLSIRNTSFQDSLFLTTIDYYNTQGELVRNYIDKPIRISPMGTVNYVIEKEDNTGGHGANFIVKISSKNSNLKPLVQAIMIGTIGTKAFSFSTDAYSIKESN